MPPHFPQLPGIQIERELGKGGFGETYLVHHPHYDAPCVLKNLHISRLGDWKSLELFEREAKVLSQLNHPNIPLFIDYIVDEQGDTLSLLQEYIPGESLEKAIVSGRYFTEAEILNIALSLARILVYLQSLQPPLIHRDIKPSNIILGENGRVYLIDFGAVRDIFRNTSSSTIVGTFGYMSPEQFSGKANLATDVYALGATLLYLLSRREPHTFEQDKLKYLFRSQIQCSRLFADLLDKMLEPDWKKRLPTAKALEGEIELVLEKNRRASVPSLSTPAYGPFLAILASALCVLIFWGWVYSRGLHETFLEPVLEKAGPAEPAELSDKELPSVREVPPDDLRPILAQGNLMYRQNLLNTLTQVQPHFWLRNETELQEGAGFAHYNIDKGSYRLSGFDAEPHLAVLYVNANPDNPSGYPGDYYTTERFNFLAGERIARDILLKKVLHLKAPQDNNAPMPYWGADCSQKFKTPSPVKIAWEPLEPGDIYEYAIMLMQCPYKTLATVAKGRTQETEMRFELPETAPDTFYLLRLYAYSGGEKVGLLTTHGTSGIAWDYRFEVGP